MIHCPACGKPNADEFRFCASCGADLAGARTWAEMKASALASSSPASHLPFGVQGGGALPAVPPPPRDPSPRTKGIIYAYTGRQAVLRLMGLIFSLVGVAVFAAVGHGLVFDIALAAAGRSERATVVDVRPDYSTSINGVHPRAIRFTTAQGIRGESSTMDLGYASSLHAGDPVTIDVIRGWPAAARVHGTMLSPLGWFGFFPLVFAVVGLPMLVAAVRSNRREIHAFRHGASAVGQVTRFDLDERVKVNGRSPTVLAWSFHVDGKAYTGSLTHMDRAVLAPLVADGGRVPVVYDDKSPAANTLYVV